jgi:ferrous iron transport protein B
LSLLAWYVFAPQCLSTLAVVRRETNGWRWPLVMTAYLFGLAYAASFVTYRMALALGG